MDNIEFKSWQTTIINVSLFRLTKDSPPSLSLELCHEVGLDNLCVGTIKGTCFSFIQFSQFKPYVSTCWNENELA
jgi:hypothetical protein